MSESPGHKPLPAFAAYVGSRSPSILIVGEAWGGNEIMVRQPFVGFAGKELFLMLGEAMPDVEPEMHSSIASMFRYDLAWIKHRGPWLESARIGMTNVLALRPPANKIEYLCAKRTEVGREAASLPAISRGIYLRDEYLPELDRLWTEINEVRPNLILAMGNTATWAILQATNIGSIRGATTESIPIRGHRYKVLPTFHPAGVLRQWSWRPIVVADLMKAQREAKFPEIRRPRRRVLINPTLDEARAWKDKVFAQLAAGEASFLSCDIETGAGMIKCISFAVTIDEALVIPFVDLSNPSGSYWPTLEAELAAWSIVQELLVHPCPKVGQNFIYDLQYITRMGILPCNCTEDTMLLHHALYPEMKKGLGFLGSIYTDESSWKLLRRKRPDTEKKDE